MKKSAVYCTVCIGFGMSYFVRSWGVLYVFTGTNEYDVTSQHCCKFNLWRICCLTFNLMINSDIYECIAYDRKRINSITVLVHRMEHDRSYQGKSTIYIRYSGWVKIIVRCVCHVHFVLNICKNNLFIYH